MPIFDPATLRTSIAAQLAAADLGDKQNVLAAVVTLDAAGKPIVRAVLSTKIGDRWSVKVGAEMNHEQRIEGGFEVKASW